MRTIKELLEAAEKEKISLGEISLRWQAEKSHETLESVRAKMGERLQIMRLSVQDGCSPELRSASGRAAPTAGSCGILPGALLAVQEEEHFSEDELISALFAAAGIGRVIALEATISGAEGGCQAECGAAAAMAAAALTQLYGGTPKQACDACSFALMNMLGLVCDPVCGLVEIPCVYRNVGGVSQAFAAAQLALSGVSCPIPGDEVILTMKDVGDALPASLRETGEGGCAGCRSMQIKNP